MSAILVPFRRWNHRRVTRKFFRAIMANNQFNLSEDYKENSFGNRYTEKDMAFRAFSLARFAATEYLGYEGHGELY